MQSNEQGLRVRSFPADMTAVWLQLRPGAFRGSLPSRLLCKSFQQKSDHWTCFPTIVMSMHTECTQTSSCVCVCVYLSIYIFCAWNWLSSRVKISTLEEKEERERGQSKSATKSNGGLCGWRSGGPFHAIVSPGIPLKLLTVCGRCQQVSHQQAH